MFDAVKPGITVRARLCIVYLIACLSCGCACTCNLLRPETTSVHVPSVVIRSKRTSSQMRFRCEFQSVRSSSYKIHQKWKEKSQDTNPAQYQDMAEHITRPPSVMNSSRIRRL